MSTDTPNRSTVFDATHPWRPARIGERAVEVCRDCGILRRLDRVHARCPGKIPVTLRSR